MPALLSLGLFAGAMLAAAPAGAVNFPVTPSPRGTAQQVAEALGVRFRISLEQRIAGAEAVGAHKTSMLQDLLAGRALEIDALVAVVRDIGAHLGLATPNIDALLGLVRLLARSRGLYPPA